MPSMVITRMAENALPRMLLPKSVFLRSMADVSGWSGKKGINRIPGRTYRILRESERILAMEEGNQTEKYEFIPCSGSRSCTHFHRF